MNKIPTLLAASAVSSASLLPPLPTPLSTPPSSFSAPSTAADSAKPTFQRLPASKLRTRLTSVGRLSHATSTVSNPSIASFFLLLSSAPADPLTAASFSTTFERVCSSPRYARFASKLDPRGRFFEPIPSFEPSAAVTQTVHPVLGKGEVQRIVGGMLTQSGLPSGAEPGGPPRVGWSAKVSHGLLGSSGVLPPNALLDPGLTTESLLFFNASHAIADGVSLGNVLTEVADERDEIKGQIASALEERKKNKTSKKKLSLLQRITKFLLSLRWFARGLATLSAQQLRMLFSSGRATNPFLPLMVPGSTKRSVAWAQAGEVRDALAVARHFNKATVNDLFVACVAGAVRRQVREHQKAGRLGGAGEVDNIKVVIPVHLFGGVLLPKQAIGNKIGAVSAEIPTGGLDSLDATRAALRITKDTPAPLVAFAAAKVVSYLPGAVAKGLMKIATSNACVAISNVRGPEKALHIGGRKVEACCGFVPPPPDVPVGVVVQSYAGKVTVTVNADAACVPDGDEFLGFVLDEYVRCAREFNVSNGFSGSGE
ncbi:hypothetical protein TeGR_g1560 [Tetraparma gracilis]|uniref:O-acyltransferase WSD1 C-terminal domain-containing protein n=1 Tax=Tetraparma gracilis TaxID=2962635 RepID=A0ABQ6MTZ0_9STRA|nr:hypothetical protein TeGR_g1560 [Tetraparma gracilis]